MKSLNDLRETARQMHAQRPSVDDDPAGFWQATDAINRINEEIARKTDQARAFRKATGFKVV